MKLRQEVKSWANDNLPANVAASTTVEADPVIPERESDEYEELGNADSKGGRRGSKTMMSLSEISVVEEAQQQDSEAPKFDPGSSDMEWLQMHRIRIPEKQSGEEGDDAQEKSLQSDAESNREVREGERNTLNMQLRRETHNRNEEEEDGEKIEQSRRLFLRNLSYSGQDDFTELFQKYGELEEVHIPVDNKTGKSKGFAYILFKI